MSNDDKRRVEIHLDGTGFGRITVGGIDMSHLVRDIKVESSAAYAPVVHLTLCRTSVDIVAEAADVEITAPPTTID